MRRSLPLSSTAVRRIDVAWRAVLAIGGGYALGFLSAMVLATGLPHLGLSRLDASIGGALAGLLAMPVVPVAAFGLRRTSVASLYIIGAGVLLALAVAGLQAT